MQDERELISIVTRGFAGIDTQLKERDDRVARIAENVIRIEGDLKNINTTLSRLDGEMSKTETGELKIRVGSVESEIKDIKARQEANTRYILGLLVTVILTLMGVIFNFISSHFKG